MCLGCCNKTGCSNIRNSFSHSSGGLKSKVKVLADLALEETLSQHADCWALAHSKRGLSCLPLLLLQEGGPLPGPKMALLSNTWKWTVWGETHTDKARDFTGKGCPGGEQVGKGTQEDCSATWLTVPGFMVMGLVFGLSGQSLWFSVLPGGTCIVQPRQVLVRRILGSGRTHGVSFWPFLNSSDWWWLVCSTFLTRTSCCKITHANIHSYYGAWPGWAVSVSVFPLTLL